jgi:arsenate reductase-like glutaredoxin family protein
VKPFGSVNAVAELTVYEKRTCTTCKNLASLLEERGIDFERVDYHVEPLTEGQIRELVRMTGRPARELFRAREPVYAESAWRSASPATTRPSPCWPRTPSSCSGR